MFGDYKLCTRKWDRDRHFTDHSMSHNNFNDNILRKQHRKIRLTPLANHLIIFKLELVSLGKLKSKKNPENLFKIKTKFWKSKNEIV